MTLREFERRLKRLNKGLSIYSTADMTRPAGVWYLMPTYHGGEYHEICGIEKRNLREFPTYTTQGKMIAGGWHRVLTMLVGLKIVKRNETYKYFGHWDEHKEPFIVFEKNVIEKSIDSMHVVGYRKIISPLDDKTEIEVPVYDIDDAVDIGRMIAKDNKRTSPPPSMETGSLFRGI